MKTEVLLRLAQEWGDATLEWEQWRAHSIEVRPGDIESLWVSGPRLFCLLVDEAEAWVDVYDFSPQASGRHLKTTTDRDGVVQRFMWPSMRGIDLSWDDLYPSIDFVNSGHDSIVLLMVNAPHF